MAIILWTGAIKNLRAPQIRMMYLFGYCSESESCCMMPFQCRRRITAAGFLRTAATALFENLWNPRLSGYHQNLFWYL